jgi:CHAT domain-containing protein/lipopolysaccharide biosynthesis regulator YciM
MRLKFVLAILWFTLVCFLSPALADDGVDPWTRGTEAVRRGQFEQAIEAWTAAAEQAGSAGNAVARSNALVRRADAYRQLGRNNDAVRDLANARSEIRAAGSRERLASIDVMIGDTYLALGDPDQAMTILTEALAFDPGSMEIATIQNSIGNLLYAQGSLERSLSAYQQGRKASGRMADPLISATLTINAARSLVALGRYTEAGTALADAEALFDQAYPTHRKSFLLIAHASVSMTLLNALKQRYPAREGLIEKSLRQAVEIADQLGDRRTRSQGMGRLGLLREWQGSNREASDLANRAIFAAQEADAADLLFRWHWMSGRILTRQNELSAAIGQYERAIQNLQRIRPDLSAAAGGFSTSFRESVGPIFMELTDLLLRRAPTQRSPEARQADLITARDVVERFKAAELQDYFQDDCVASLQARATAIDHLELHTAALYPILLPDRAELLLSLESGLKQFTVPIGSASVIETAHRLRPQLEKRTTNRFLVDAQLLYDWLIRPLEGDLTARGIDTLVVVPDGPLRGIPFAALHDGRQFLIERVAVAVTPGLSLLEPRPLTIGRSRLLLAGLTDPVQGFPALPYVAEELSVIGLEYGGMLLKDQQFRQDAVRSALASVPYSVIHIASHGKFESEAKNSFLLTYDGRLTMDELERLVKLSEFRREPVELLTLSACQTAVGDDRAALGLAGIAIKAGARSALATLWFVNDQASSLLVAQFYRHLSDRNQSKAKALQKAQLSLLNDARYQHPGYWGPFMMIGNWL